MGIQSYIEPIREGERENSLICKFLMPYNQSFVTIGLTIEHFMILTDQKGC